MNPSPSQGLVPNFNAWLGTAWGAGAEFCNVGALGFFGSATNLVFGTNPPYYLDDFLAVFPKFFGVPASYANVAVTTGGYTATMASTAGLLIGQFLVSADFPKGTLITAVAPTTVTLNNAALDTNPSGALQVYTAPPIPVAITQLYINLATASLVQARWQEQWTVAMAWFVAHYLTLYARSDAAEVYTALQPALHQETPVGAVPGTVYTLSATPPGGALDGLFVNGLFQKPGAGADYTLVGNTITFGADTPAGAVITATWAVPSTVQTAGVPSTAQIAAQGLINGIMTSKSVGDVSASYSVLEDQAGWGTFRMTMYGAQLIDMAKVVGMGPMVIW